MDSTIISNIGLTIICIMFVVGFINAMHTKDKAFEREREQWRMERKDLLDRIQAPDFNQYAAKVIREKKAEHPEEPQEEIEFVS